MGGNAFASTLLTPRMPLDVYEHTSTKLSAVLEKHFKYVGCPIEAPGKVDYGDIDFIVAEPLDSDNTSSQPKDLAQVLGAVQYRENNATTSYAVPWPQLDQKCEEQPTSPGLPHSTSDSDSSSTKYIQIDVHICLDSKNFHWYLFFHAHGDLWNMLGGIIRKFGMTCTDQGLFLRIAEIEDKDRKLRRVKMTDTPSEVLRYLGLDEQRYWSKFNTWDEMMDYAATCRFYNPARPKKKATITTASVAPSDNKDPSTTETDTIIRGLKANDRQRARKRNLFNHWITVYLPSHSTDPPGTSSHLTRDEIITDAKRFFGPDFAHTFDKQRREGIRETGTTALFSELRRTLPVEGNMKGWVTRGLKREIIVPDFLDESGSTNSTESGGDLTEVQRLYAENRFDDVKKWAVENYQEVGARQKIIDDEEGKRSLLRKADKDRVVGLMQAAKLD